MKILVCGNEGSGKTTLAKPLAKLLNAKYVNKDSYEKELRGYVDGIVAADKSVVIDKRCSSDEAIEYLNPDFIIWMDTAPNTSYKPFRYDYHVSEWFDDTHVVLVEVLKKYMDRGYHNV